MVNWIGRYVLELYSNNQKSIAVLGNYMNVFIYISAYRKNFDYFVVHEADNDDNIIRICKNMTILR